MISRSVHFCEDEIPCRSEEATTEVDKQLLFPGLPTAPDSQEGENTAGSEGSLTDEAVQNVQPALPEQEG